MDWQDCWVDVSGIDRRTFFLQFRQIAPDRRWSGPTERNLELRTSLGSFHHVPGYAGWVRLVIAGFLDSQEAEATCEAYDIERSVCGTS